MSLSPDFTNELRRHFTGDIRLDLASRILYSTDASIYQIEPLGVVLPKSQDELHAAVELAAKYKVPILPDGAGTSLQVRQLVMPSFWIVHAGWIQLLKLMQKITAQLLSRALHCQN